jgi:hypothetical protein
MAIDTAAEVVAAYGAAWDEQDEQARRALLERAWTDDGTYTDPTAHAEGREGLVAHIGGFHARMPGFRIVIASGVDGHGGCLRFAWQMLDPQGEVALEGLDFAEQGPDGRLKRIVGFFGPLPPA